MSLSICTAQLNYIVGDLAGNTQKILAAAEQAYAQINRLIDQQAFTRAADDIFLGSAMLFLLLIVLIWFTKRPAPHGGGAAEAAGAH